MLGGFALNFKKIFVVPFLFFFLVSCNNTTSTLNTTSPSPTTSSNSPQKTNSIIENKESSLSYVQVGSPSTLDPAYYSTVYENRIVSNIFEGLIDIKSAGSLELEGKLAESWKKNATNTEYTFHLHKNVKFHDGTSFNADSVIFNFKRQMKPLADKEMSSVDLFDEIIKDVVKIDDYTVKFILKKPYLLFIENIAVSSIASPSAIKKYGVEFYKHPVGTGPFQLDTWNDKEIVLSKHNSYWNGKANIDRIIIKAVSEKSKRVSMLLSGQADLIDINADDVDRLSSSGKVVLKGDSLKTTFIGFNCARPPFNNLNMRIAFARAIDKTQEAKVKFKGYAEPANSFVPKVVEGYTTSNMYDYNPDVAKQLINELKKTNYEVKLVSTKADEVTVKMLKKELENIGLQLKVIQANSKDYMKKILSGEPDIFFLSTYGMSTGMDSYITYFDSKQIPNYNLSSYRNNEFDTLYEKMRNTTNINERQEIALKINNILQKDIPMLPICYPQNLMAHSENVKNIVIHPSSFVYFKDVVIDK